MTRDEIAVATHRRDLATLDAVIEHGGEKHAAHALGRSRRVISGRLMRLRRRYGVTTTIQAVYLASDELHQLREGR